MLSNQNWTNNTPKKLIDFFCENQTLSSFLGNS